MNKELTTLFTGRDEIRLSETSSTNSYMSNRLKETKPVEGSLVISGFQSDGRGQAGSGWVSEPGKNLLASFVFYPVFLSTVDVFQLSKFFALGVASALELLTGEKIKIKWPNDIYFKYKKLGGILIENTIVGGKVVSCICGLGLNVNQVEFTKNLPNPVSLKLISSKEFSLEEVKNSICNEVEAQYLKLKSGRSHELSEEFLKRLYLFNTWSLYKDVTGSFTGRIIGLEKSGRLLIEKEAGELKSYDIKELVFGLK